MKLNKGWWIAIIAVSIVIPLTLVILITRIFVNPAASWWWTGGVLILQGIAAIISGLVFLISRFNKVELSPEKLDPKEAEKRAIEERKHDDVNPDNFNPKDKVIVRVGESGLPRTTIFWLAGRGTEKNQKLDALIYLDKPQEPTTWLVNKSDKIVMEIIKTMAENPTSEIKEERVMGTDDYGRPTTKIVSTRLSQAEKKAEEQKQEAEESNIV